MNAFMKIEKGEKKVSIPKNLLGNTTVIKQKSKTRPGSNNTRNFIT